MFDSFLRNISGPDQAVCVSCVVWCGVVWCGVVWCGVVPMYCAV